MNCSLSNVPSLSCENHASPNVTFYAVNAFHLVTVHLSDNLVGFEMLYLSLKVGELPNHSTETALTKTISDLRRNPDENTLGWFFWLLNWSKKIKGRKFYISLVDHVSEKRQICFGVTQGSFLGPLLFSLYMQITVHLHWTKCCCSSNSYRHGVYWLFLAINTWMSNN